MSHSGRTGLLSTNSGTPQSASPSDEDAKDDPSQVDTIVLGDPGDAPVPARPGDHVSPVHATVIVHLPRTGSQVGLIPNSPAGQRLYAWLAAFNQGNDDALRKALPNVAAETLAAAQLELRQKTGGFSLLSAREVVPGVLVFRLRDQTPAANEVLGTLQVHATSNPGTIASFSLRRVAAVRPNAANNSNGSKHETVQAQR